MGNVIGHMEASAETSVDLGLNKVEENSPRTHEAWVLGISLIVSIWMWAAFVRGRGIDARWQLLFLIGALAGMGGFRQSVSWILRRHCSLHQRKRNKTLAFSYSAFLLLVVFLPECLLGKPPLLAKSLTLLVFSLLLFAVYFLTAVRCASPPSRTLRLPVRPRMALLGFGIIYFALSSYVAIAKLHGFSYVGQDIAYFTQCLYTTLHGHLFYSNMYHDLLYSKPVSSDFAGHNQLILALFLPFYVLHRSASTLLIVRNLAIVLCAWPVYLISRRTMSSWLSVLTAIAFLLVPAVLYQNTYDFAPLSLAAFPLLFALYYFLEGRFRPFVIALVLTQLVREDLVFAVFGLGLLALSQKRSARWVIVPCGLSVLWALLSWKIVFPHFLQGSTSAVSSCFAYMGTSPSQMMRFVVSHPATFFSRGNLLYLKQLVDPLGGVLFLPGTAWLLSLPYVAINLLAEGGGCHTAMIYRHYALIPAVLLFASYLFSLEWTAAFFRKRNKAPEQLQGAIVSFVLFAALGGILFVTGRTQLDELRDLPWHEEARRVESIIPSGASVAMPRYMLPSAANRSELYQSLRLLEYLNLDAQYIVIDKDWSRMAASYRYQSNYYLLWNLLKINSQYNAIYDSPNYVIYKRCDGCKNSLPHFVPEQDIRE
jgi:uncharacterized membrane protein